MTFKKVSVLVPTRRRIERLGRFIESYRSTVGDGAAAELVFRCDNDDADSIHYLSAYDWKILIGPRLLGYRSLPSFYNDMAKIATGDVLACGNDDMLFLTQGWPALILEVANRYPDGIFNLGINTGLNDEKFPFSIVSRKLHDALGFINDTRLLFSDMFLLDVMAHFNRNVRVTNVTFFHDWAGHGAADRTRQEANRHEFDMVFADVQGNWTREYREKHDSVVREAVEKIKQTSDVMPSIVLANFSQYRPPASADRSKPWPPAIAPERWYGGANEPAIHYHREEVFSLLKELFRLPVTRGTALLTSLNNGLPGILWGQVFDTVVAISAREKAEEPIIEGKYTICFGSVGDTKFLYKTLDLIGQLDCLILDDLRYANLISPYFLFRRAMRRPGIIIFFNTGGVSEAHDGVMRFMADIRSGSLDGICHDIRDILVPGGVGVSYELVV